MFIVTDVQAFRYEKLGKGFGSLAEVLMLKVLSGQGVSGGGSIACTSVTHLTTTVFPAPTPRYNGAPSDYICLAPFVTKTRIFVHLFNNYP